MTKVRQNLVVLMEPSEEAWVTSLKVGNMILNRFCIDEDTAFELSGINYLKPSSEHIKRANNDPWGWADNDLFKRKRKGNGYSFIYSFSSPLAT